MGLYRYTTRAKTKKATRPGANDNGKSRRMIKIKSRMGIV